MDLALPAKVCACLLFWCSRFVRSMSTSLPSTSPTSIGLIPVIQYRASTLTVLLFF